MQNSECPDAPTPYRNEATEAPQSVHPEGVMSHVHGTLENLSNLVSSLEDLANHLCGSAPPATTGQTINKDPDGAFPQLRDRAEYAGNRVRDGFRAIERIRGAL